MNAVTAAAVCQAAGTGLGGRHVFGSGRRVDAATGRVAALIDPVFLFEAGWDAARLVLSPPAAHPLLGRPVCRAPGCPTTATVAGRICGSCLRRLAECGLGLDQIDRLPARPVRLGDGPAEVVGVDRCPVLACERGRRHRDGLYCEAHQQRLRTARAADAGLDEERWRRIEPPVSRGGQVSFAGLAPLVIAEVLLGLQQRCRLTGVKTTEADLRGFCNELRRQQATTVTDHVHRPGGREGTFTAMVNALRVQAARVLSGPESEVVKDVWDLAVFGHCGTVSFTGIRQRWLREAAKRWAADDLPRRRVRAGKRTSTGLAVRHYVRCLVRLSQTLRLRPDRGEVPAALGRTDIETFLHRLAYQESTGDISTDARIRACREVKAVLSRIRAMGLTRPGAVAGRLGDDFAIHREDVPVEAEPGEPGRDLPTEVMRQLCAQLAELSSPQMRTAIELTIDTGRRPEEICALGYDCLARDADGSAVLIFHNHKANRADRRLPISETTATVIIAQQQRVRARYPHTPVGELTLLPTDRRNPAGRRSLTPFSVAFAHRAWVDRMPVLHTGDGIEFDKRRVVLYAYRHTYAQRHADAGVPIDVLRELMDHRKLDTTKRYYRVGENRRREAVDRVAALQFDRHGTRVWRQAKALLDTEYARRMVGEVVVPFGVCAEPSNVKAGGHACPYRFRCVGCDHFRTDASYLPDLQAHLDDLLRNRERLLAATDIDPWAKTEALPSDEEIGRIRRLIRRIGEDLADLTPAERTEIDQAVALIRRHRTVSLGMPRVRQPLPNIRGEHA